MLDHLLHMPDDAIEWSLQVEPCDVGAQCRKLKGESTPEVSNENRPLGQMPSI
jgi:hypothetical protein